MPQEKAQASAYARGKREPAHRGEIDGTPIAGKFRDHDHDRAAFKRLLHGPERIDGARHHEHMQAFHW